MRLVLINFKKHLSLSSFCGNFTLLTLITEKIKSFMGTPPPAPLPKTYDLPFY